MFSTPLLTLGVAATSALVVALSGKASAQNADEMAAIRANCRMDYLRFCAGMSPGGPEVRACFQRNRANLSDGCSASIGDYEARQANTPPSR
ncbi:hypothetical protein ASF49_21480 [Methylobacterium sp. Leaf104]|uniref:hypothetical protein n=1 Tax=Methylobacterium TaxID=407 RepID=UPI0006F4F277|nr:MULTISPECIES: hypothetical protein [Methylobacterium]KQP40075.1 hypothetical protein ASF49_21480 [Methylobacterium sp. Leaf104]MCI9881962.1 hypothetical protein [Methylobacterium goesingense]